MSKQTDLINIPDAITVDGSNVGIGTSSPVSVSGTSLVVHDTSAPRVRLTNDTTGQAGTDGSEITVNGSDLVIENRENTANTRFYNGGAERMRIDASGNVGIGCVPNSIQSNFDTLQIGGNLTLNVDSTGANAGVYMGNNVYRDSTNSRWEYIYTDEASQYYQANGNHVWRTASSGSANAAISWSERMRIDPSGNLMVGKTSGPNYNAVGVDLTSLGEGQFTVSGNPVLTLNRQSSYGDMAHFRKDGTLVGSIGSFSSTIFYLASNGNALKIAAPASGVDAFGPATTTGNNRDNAMDIGWSSNRFDDIYATNGTIQTSDFNEKQDVASLTATEMLVGKRISALFKTFRWKDSVAEKGDNARTHAGVIAQDVQAAFTAEGLDAGDYALFISSTWWETQTEVPAVEAVEAVTETTTDEDGNEVVTVITEAVEAKDAYTRIDHYHVEDEAPEGATSKTRLGIRYPELLAFVAAYNEQRFASIEARLTALEA